MQYQCPKCYGYEIVTSKPRNKLPWIVTSAVLDAVIIILYFSGIIESLVVLIILLAVIELLFLPPLLRAMMSSNQSTGGQTYRCTSCGHTWSETDATANAVSPAIAEEISYTGSSSVDGSISGAVDARVGAEVDSHFQMTIDNVFGIKNRGTIVVGCVETGSINQGATVYIHGANGVIRTVVDAIEIFRKVTDSATVGQTVGMLLRGVERSSVKRGDILKGAP